MTTKLTQNQMIAKIITSFGEKNAIEETLWKWCFKPTIEALRKIDIDHDNDLKYFKQSAMYLQRLIKEIEAFKVETCYTPEYHVKNALLAALTGKDHMVVISWLADAYKYDLRKEYDRMQNESINQ